MEARDTAKRPAMHRTLSPQQRIIWTKMLIVLKLRNLALEEIRSDWLTPSQANSNSKCLERFISEERKSSKSVQLTFWPENKVKGRLQLIHQMPYCQPLSNCTAVWYGSVQSWQSDFDYTGINAKQMTSGKARHWVIAKKHPHPSLGVSSVPTFPGVTRLDNSP